MKLELRRPQVAVATLALGALAAVWVWGRLGDDARDDAIPPLVLIGVPFALAWAASTLIPSAPKPPAVATTPTPITPNAGTAKRVKPRWVGHVVWSILCATLLVTLLSVMARWAEASNESTALSQQIGQLQLGLEKARRDYQDWQEVDKLLDEWHAEYDKHVRSLALQKGVVLPTEQEYAEARSPKR